MANATGESESDALRLDFDRRLTLQFARIWASVQFKKNVYHSRQSGSHLENPG